MSRTCSPSWNGSRSFTRQCYTTARHGGTPRRPRARPRLVLRARSRGDAPLLSRHPRPAGDRHRQERAHRVLLRRRPPSRRVVRAGSRRRPGATAQGRPRALPRRLHGRRLARRAGRGAPLGRIARPHPVRRIRARLLRPRPRRSRDRALRGHGNCPRPHAAGAVKLDHVAIWAVDIERMRTFYEKYFDARSSPKYENERKRFTSYFLTFPRGGRLELDAPTGHPTDFGFTELARVHWIRTSRCRARLAGRCRRSHTTTAGRRFSASRWAKTDGRRI